MTIAIVVLCLAILATATSLTVWALKERKARFEEVGAANRQAGQQLELRAKAEAIATTNRKAADLASKALARANDEVKQLQARIAQYRAFIQGHAKDLNQSAINDLLDQETRDEIL